MLGVWWNSKVILCRQTSLNKHNRERLWPSGIEQNQVMICFVKIHNYELTGTFNQSPICWMKFVFESAVCFQPVSETSFHKDVTCQGRGTRTRKISKENEDPSENNKSEAEDSTEREFHWILKSPVFNSICLNTPPQKVGVRFKTNKQQQLKKKN